MSAGPGRRAPRVIICPDPHRADPNTRDERKAFNMATEPNPADLAMDANSLYREDTYTDRRLGVIRVLTPVGGDGATDGSRPVLYLGEAQLLTPAGALP